MGFKVDGKVTVTGQARSKFILTAPVWAATGPQHLNSGGTTDARTIDGNGDTWIAGFVDGYAARSTDAGVTWTALPQYLNSGASSLEDIWKIRSDQNGTWVAVMSNGYAARSVDDGATWSALPQQLNSGWFTGGDRGTGTWVGLGTDRNGTWIAGGADGFSSRSVDNGATWSGIPRGLGASNTDNQVRTFAANYDSASQQFIGGGDNGVSAYSTDDGATWNQTPYFQQNFVNGYGADYSGGKFIVGTSNGFMRVSTDGGATWTAGTKGFGSGSLSAVPFALAADSNGVWVSGHTDGWSGYSLDNGVTWNANPQGLNTAGSSTARIRDLRYGGDRWMAILEDGYVVRSI